MWWISLTTCILLSIAQHIRLDVLCRLMTSLPVSAFRSTRECVYLATLIYLVSCFCDLDLDLDLHPMTLTYELCLDLLKMYLRTKNEVSIAFRCHSHGRKSWAMGACPLLFGLGTVLSSVSPLSVQNKCNIFHIACCIRSIYAILIFNTGMHQIPLRGEG